VLKLVTGVGWRGGASRLVGAVQRYITAQTADIECRSGAVHNLPNATHGWRGWQGHTASNVDHGGAALELGWWMSETGKPLPYGP
jgi:hypothetical protein